MAQAQRGSWTVTAVNTVVAATVLALVAVLALVVNPPAPPSIAAFAPQAAKPISKAPPGQSAQFGNGAGACGEGQVCVGPTPTPTPTPGASPRPVVASLPPKVLKGAVPPGLQCYEWPDGTVTQTFDPQSPPCVSIWDDAKGNGGATSMGVTATEVRVALPVASSSTWPTLQPIVDFFNTRFQLYGRQIRIVPVPSQQADGNLSGQWNDPVLQKADAAQIAANKVFATFDFIDPTPESATVPVFLEAMRKAKIVSINGGDVTPFDTAKHLSARAPYAWSYYATIDQLLDNVATMTCRQLVGRAASHSTDAGMRTKTRKFAVVLPTEEELGGALPGLGTLLATLDGCGVKEPKVLRMNPGAREAAGNSAALQQLKSDGVTSILFLPWGSNGAESSSILSLAERVSFFPEWVLMGAYNYNTANMLRDPPSETGGAFGVGVWNKQPQLALEMWNQAVVAAGGDSTTAGTVITGRAFYQEMLLLASGIQMAGPQLTPESFARGLREAEFPNPGRGTAPFFQGSVGFVGDDPVMVDDFTAFWLDTRTSAQQATTSTAANQEKAFCMVGRGLRYRDESWPTTEHFYQGTCR